MRSNGEYSRQAMNRNNGREISRRLIVLRDYLYANADKTAGAVMEPAAVVDIEFCAFVTG